MNRRMVVAEVCPYREIDLMICKFGDGHTLIIKSAHHQISTSSNPGATLSPQYPSRDT